MSRRLLITASILALATSTACSSSSSTGTTPPAQDSGTTNENDSSIGAEDSGTPTGDGSSATDTGIAPTGDGSMPLACAPADDAGTYASVTYVPSTKGTNQCASTDITAFVTACGNSQTMTSCQDWFAANVAGMAADGGGAGSTCGNCIANPNGAGALWFDPFGYFNWNYAGCIQLTDTTNGTACAGAFNNIDGCQAQYCDQCSDNTTYGQCSNATIASGGQCASYNSTFNTACANDLGIGDGGTAAAACFPSMGAANSDPDITYIATLICGSGQ
jgi:hypothetical protein